MRGTRSSISLECWTPSGTKIVAISSASSKDLLFNPRKRFVDLLHELERKMPHIKEEERMSIALSHAGLSEKLAQITKITGHDWRHRPYLRDRWEERMPLLTDPQKRCIARLLVHILERTADPHEAPRIQTMLDKYWSAFLTPESLPNDPAASSQACCPRDA